jgi:peptidoglycan/LPS O-acetylase OafA/YrhL
LNVHFQSVSTQRLAFADLLRGLAALTVALGHFLVLFPKSPDLVAKITMAEPNPAVTFPATFAKAYSIFDLASIGVGVFFLISGFVIPLSLEGASARAFWLKRFLRIYPTYWVAFAAGVASIFVSAGYWSKPVTYDWVDFFANTFLLADFFGRFDIPSVMWTLQIELKFYLLIPVFYATLSRGSLLRVFLWGVGVIALYWLPTSNCSQDLDACWSHYRFSVLTLLREAIFISYMLIGSIVYAHYRGLISTPRAAFGVVFMFACFSIASLIAPFHAVSTAYPLPFFWGALIFIPCYLLRDRINLTPPFRFLANISYPLYVVHPLLGYVTMRLLMAAGLPYPTALAAALILVIAVAMAIHLYVEEPSIALGKRLATRIEGSRRAPRTAPEQLRACLPRTDQPVS